MSPSGRLVPGTELRPRRLAGRGVAGLMVVLGVVGIASAGLALLAVSYVDALPPERPTTTASLPRREVAMPAPAASAVGDVRPTPDRPKPIADIARPELAKPELAKPEIAKPEINKTVVPARAAERPVPREASIPPTPRPTDPAPVATAAPKAAGMPRTGADEPARQAAPSTPAAVATRPVESRPVEIVLAPPPPVPAAAVALQGEIAPLPMAQPSPPLVRTARTDVVQPPSAADVVVPFPPPVPAIVTAEIATRPVSAALPETRPLPEARPSADARPVAESKPIVETKSRPEPEAVAPGPVVAVRATRAARQMNVRTPRAAVQIAARPKVRAAAGAGRTRTREARRRPARDPETTGSTRPSRSPIRSAAPAPRLQAEPAKPFSLPDALRPGTF